MYVHCTYVSVWCSTPALSIEVLCQRAEELIYIYLRHLSCERYIGCSVHKSKWQNIRTPMRTENEAYTRKARIEALPGYSLDFFACHPLILQFYFLTYFGGVTVSCPNSPTTVYPQSLQRSLPVGSEAPRVGERSV